MTLPSDGVTLNDDFRGAVAEYRRILTLNPNRARTRHKLARALEEMGQREEAMAEHRRVLSVWKNADPDAPEIRYATRAQHARR